MNEKTHFNPDQYNRTANYASDNEKPLDEMTIDDAIMIVCDQAHESDFYNEVVQKAINIAKEFYENLTRPDANGDRLYFIPDITDPDTLEEVND